jgi:hypothetical protein
MGTIVYNVDYTNTTLSSSAVLTQDSNIQSLGNTQIVLGSLTITDSNGVNIPLSNFTIDYTNGLIQWSS